MSVKFTVIIPVYNDSEDLQKTLNCISEQDYDIGKVQVIVVDNGSSENISTVVDQYQFAELIYEKNNLNSPYSCRNRGIEQAKGDIIVFLDATCKPSNRWLLSGEKCMENTGLHIIGGDVKFDFKDKITAGKIFDSVLHIRMEDSIKERGIAPTANLFVYAECFKKLGKFKEGIRSGGDVEWTKNATENGYVIGFCKNARVFKTARTFTELIKKRWRVSLHKPRISLENGESFIIYPHIRNILVPASPFRLMKEKEKLIPNEYNMSFFKYWFVSQTLRYVVSLAKIIGHLKVKSNKSNEII